tara:strand:+ start:2690 stop:3445 length:756 start_codon:yes stop_codon:yes gene_type:complete
MKRFLNFKNSKKKLTRFYSFITNSIYTIMKPSSPIELDKVVVEDINEYPFDFINFAQENNLSIPDIKTGNGKALCAMLKHSDYYWTRKECDAFVKKFNISTNDSIQLFNKHEQRGIKCSNERGKNYVIVPYELSNKHKMRKNFAFDGTEEEKNIEINKIKSTIKADYIDVDNKEWQLGHKNPDSTDSSNKNLVLQPPIQAKYRDKYIFLDTLTKIPTPKTIIELVNSENCPYTREQLIDLKKYFSSMEIPS